MRFKLTLTLALLTLVFAARAQEPPQEDQKIIEDFVNTRGVILVEPAAKKPASNRSAASRNKARPKQGKGSAAPKNADGAAAKPGNAAPNSGAAAQESVGAGADSRAGSGVLKVGSQALKLGYTLYRKRDNLYFPEDASGEFRNGDALRLSLETNTDGYVYVFNTTNNAQPELIYPSVEVERAANRVLAHSRAPIPPDDEKDIVFDGPPGAERLYIVVTRRPLPGVPVGEELMRLCGGVEECEWKPTASEWKRLLSLFESGGRFREQRVPQLAKLEPLGAAALTRGLTIKKSASPPAVVRVSDSPTAELLVATIDLIHK